MFDLDKWQEIFEVIKANKLRTFLTAFSVSWGIFMLILLLGAGQGLRNGFENQFKDDAVNSVWVSTGSTGLAYKGMKPNRRIQLTNAEYDLITQSFDEIDHSTARQSSWGAQMDYKEKTTNLPYRGAHPGHQVLENTEMRTGRFLIEQDLKDKAKVAILGQDAVIELFGNEDPMGKYFSIWKVPFKVIGTFEDFGGRWEKKMVYIPITTAQQVFGGGENIDRIMFTTGNAPIQRVDQMIGEITQIIIRQTRF